MNSEFDIIVVGAGLVGITTALSCADSGAKVALLDRSEIVTGSDGRASALSTTSLQLFENLGVDLSKKLQPICDMLVTEGEPDSPWRLHFEGDGDGADLGALIENPALKAALIKRVEEVKSVRTFAPIALRGFEESADGVVLDTDHGQLSAKLLIAADGRNSVLRRKAGITAQRFDYEASSLVTTISHALPHDGLAWQRIIKGGALAVLPLTGNRSQIVWSGPTKAVQAAKGVSETDFLALLSEKMDGYLGEMNCLAPRQTYPLRLQVADGFSKGRIALVGDAAHIIHPLAGQGLNLGLRDAAALADGVKTAIETGQDIGVIALLDYDFWRSTDTRSLGFLTHLISEISGTKSAALSHARRLGLALTNSSTELKSALGKRASGKGRELPRLMQNRY
ncbi:MAG: FAD-dependent oxidoreductase [Litorimonas sp.]